MRKMRAGLWVLSAAVSFTACSDAAEPTASVPVPTASPARLSPGPVHWRGVEADFARIEQEVPGFGGYFYDEEGRLTAYVTDQRHEPAARAALERVARAVPRSLHARQNSEIRIRQGRYSFAQLSHWRDRLTSLISVPGWQSLDVSERRNRIVVRVETEAAARAAQAEVARLGIPADAVVLMDAEPIRLTASLEDPVRPVPGGVRITSSVGACTLGYGVILYGKGSYLTNSHCTQERGQVDGITHYQAGGSDLIGFEYADPAFFNGVPGCESTTAQCRYSDAALGEYVNGVLYYIGSIARTAWRGQLSGSRDITGFFRIAGEQAYPVEGQYLDRMGATTGWVYGEVVSACEHIGNNGVLYLCQGRVIGAGSADGDSGSPVFLWTTEGWNGNTVHAAGLQWGGGSNYFVFSPVGGLKADLGPIEFF